MPAPALEGEALTYSIDEPDPVAFDKLPAWVQDKIANRVVDVPVMPKAAPAAPKPAAAPVNQEFTDDEIAF